MSGNKSNCLTIEVFTINHQFPNLFDYLLSNQFNFVCLVIIPDSKVILIMYCNINLLSCDNMQIDEHIRNKFLNNSIKFIAFISINIVSIQTLVLNDPHRKNLEVLDLGILGATLLGPVLTNSPPRKTLV